MQTGSEHEAGGEAAARRLLELLSAGASSEELARVPADSATRQLPCTSVARSTPTAGGKRN